MAAEKDFELVDAYLANRMTVEERAAFEQKIASEPALQKEVALQQTIVASVRKARAAELKAMLNNVPISPIGTTTLVSKVAIGIAVTALVGTSGSGKTTIAGLVASFLNPDSGVITIDGQDLGKVSLDSYRGQLGVVLQDDFLFEGTIKENILFPRPNATEDELQRAVKGAFVHEFTDRFEKGLETGTTIFEFTKDAVLREFGEDFIKNYSVIKD